MKKYICISTFSTTGTVQIQVKYFGGQIISEFQYMMLSLIDRSNFKIYEDET